MPSRSWMAVLALSTLTLATSPRPARADDAPVQNRVSLQIQITGLASPGCAVEIRPGHPGCQFAPIRREVRSYAGGGTVRLDPITIDAQSLGADRDCSFAITIDEPGQPRKTYRRGIRLSPPNDAGATMPTQSLKLYLSAPSIAATVDTTTLRR